MYLTMASNRTAHLRRADGRGQPRYNPREVMNGILWVMRTGVAWPDIPSRYPSSSIRHRYFQAWVSVCPDSELCTWPDRLGSIDGTFVPAKKGSPPS